MLGWGRPSRCERVAALVFARGQTVAAWMLGLLLIAAGIGALLSGCASQTPAPVYGWDEKTQAPDGHYRVKAGDTLSEVAGRLKIDFANLVRWNDLKPPYKIVSGRLLWIVPPGKDAATPAVAGTDGGGKAPGASGKTPKPDDKASATKPAKAKPNDSEAKVTQSKTGGGAGDAGGTLGLRWQWPLKGPIRQTFVRGDRTRAGIRIAGRTGDQVLAAEAGTVVYSGSGLKGYGNLIIVQHNKNYLSAYGFNRRLLVHEGDRVRRGQAVAEVGQTAGGDWLLHFEIRRNGTAVDPMGYLPRSR